ncbi:MAG: YgcG family protein [Leptospiraceae bacterium]|nr:YgcG family protein [Leptospiraceae bacterium]MDW7976787.1 YgcG family protein [Leptospiraceae bacterium]
MKKIYKLYLSILLIIWNFFSISFLSAQGNQDFVPIPPLTGRVVDLTNTLTETQINQLTNKLEQIEQTTKAQVVVVLLPTTGIETIEEYSIRLAEEWKIGRKGYDDGLILLVAKEDRKIRLEVGYGLEGIIPDAIAKRILSEVIIPEFRKGNFYEGIDKGIDVIRQRLQSEEQNVDFNRSDQDATQEDTGKYFTIVIIPMFVAFFLRYLLGFLRSFLVTAFGTTILSLFLFGFSWEILFLIFLFSFLGSLGVFSKGRTSVGFSRGGFSYGGGFSGGGGGFGGGGASGSW